MKFYDIHEVDTIGRTGRLLKSATAEQFEEFKNRNTTAKFLVVDECDEYANLKGYDFCAYTYEAKILFALYELKTFTNSLNQDEDFWIEIKTYSTEKAAYKRIKSIMNNIFGKDKEIDTEKYMRFSALYKVTQRYQTYEEATN